MRKFGIIVIVWAAALAFPAVATAVPSWYQADDGRYDSYLSASGDANHDGIVDLSDFVVIKQNYGASGNAWIPGDLNGDGEVQLDDFVVLKQQFHTVVAEPDNVIIPEPLSLLTVALGMAATGRYLRKRVRA